MRSKNGLGRERLKITFEQFGAGRILVGLGRIPARGRKQPRRRAIDIVLPWREQLNVAPLAHRVTDAGAGFQDDRQQAPLQHMGGGGEADRAGSDDGDRLDFALGFTHVVLPSN